MRTLLALTLTASLLTPASPEPPALTVGRTEHSHHWRANRDSTLFVAVIGSDVREGNPFRGRGDSLHIVSWNPRLGAGTILGIPRDTLANVPGRGPGKINNALLAGGDAMTEAMSSLTGIPIQYWVAIDFAGFRRLVDGIGGMNVDVPYRIVEAKSGARFDAGTVPMDGAAALAFARVRYGIPEGDIGRSANQGRILLSALSKFQGDTQDPLTLGHWISLYSELAVSNVGVGDLLELAAIGRSMDPSKLSNVVARGGFGSVGGASVITLGADAAALFANVADDGVIN